jgi:hypothetical protein
VDLPGLTPALSHPAAHVAQRFLATAYDSVEALADAYGFTSEVAKEDAVEFGNEVALRTETEAENLLRAALVFSGAGVDATLKQLTRDALPRLLQVSEEAVDKLASFTERRLSSDLNRMKALARYITSHDPRSAVIDDYVRELTGPSLQSVDQVQTIVGALGIVDSHIRKEIRELQPLFEARNQIVHEFDLIAPRSNDARVRRERTLSVAIDLAVSGLDIVQRIINAVVEILGGEQTIDIPSP